MKRALLLYGLLNAVLYSMLLPLWEGFDEPFHYGYVEALSTGRGLPVLGVTGIPQEVAESLDLAPASYVVRQNLPSVITFEDWFRLPRDERAARRTRLETLPASMRDTFLANAPNYEAQQTPLAYAVLAAADRWWSGLPLPRRVLRVRLVGAILATLLQAWATLALARELQLPPAAGHFALFLVFSCQMFWATVAHICNDWLSVTLSSVFVLALVRWWRVPDRARSLQLGCALGAGLLAKAYFLSWVVFAALAIWRRRAGWKAAVAAALPVLFLAGPWYGRNLALYGTLSGHFQAAGIGLFDVLRTAIGMPWPGIFLAAGRGALWTGNNSFTAFSANTLNVVLLLLSIGGVLWARTARGRPAEILAAAACLFYIPTQVYATALFYTYKPGVLPASPWYTQLVAVPFACLIAAGLYRAGKPGRVIQAGLAALAVYLISATYLLKLIPLYGGYGAGRAKLGALMSWYRSTDSEILGQTALGSPLAIYTLTAAVALLAAALAVKLATSPPTPNP